METPLKVNSNCFIPEIIFLELRCAEFKVQPMKAVPELPKQNEDLKPDKVAIKKKCEELISHILKMDGQLRAFEQ